MRRRYTKDELISLLQQMALRNGAFLCKRHLDEDDTMPSEMTFRKSFGSWGNAVREAGFEPMKPSPSQKCMERTVEAHKGKRSFNWKGGRVMNNGYIEIYKPEHPNANVKGYIREHRYVMSEMVGRPLTEEEDVHHINGVKTDNRPENLQLLLKSEHTKLHHLGVPKRQKLLKGE